MKINVAEPWYKDNLTAVFHTENNVTSVFYWTCRHVPMHGECIHCALVLEDEAYDE